MLQLSKCQNRQLAALKVDLIQKLLMHDSLRYLRLKLTVILT